MIMFYWEGSLYVMNCVITNKTNYQKTFIIKYDNTKNM